MQIPLTHIPVILCEVIQLFYSFLDLLVQPYHPGREGGGREGGREGGGRGGGGREGGREGRRKQREGGRGEGGREGRDRISKKQ